jgi:hypothetical protein
MFFCRFSLRLFGSGKVVKTQRKEIFILELLILCALIGCAGLGMAAASESGEELRVSQAVAQEHLNDPNTNFLDVRQEGAWEDSNEKIVSAIRKDPQNLDAWAADYSSEDTLFLYCS